MFESERSFPGSSTSWKDDWLRTFSQHGTINKNWFVKKTYCGSSFLGIVESGRGAYSNSLVSVFGLNLLNAELDLKSLGTFIAFLFGSLVVCRHFVHSLMLPDN